MSPAREIVFPPVEELPLHALTDREQDVIWLVAQGETNAGIANALGIHPSTVETHLENIYQKLGAQNRANAISITFGVLPFDPPEDYLY